MKQFAPKPWRRGIGNEAHTVFDAQGRIVADKCGYDDGHLIAAAPDMLAELKLLYERHPYQSTLDVIEKAER